MLKVDKRLLPDEVSPTAVGPLGAEPRNFYVRVIRHQLPTVIVSGLTTPEKRTNSVPLSNEICFSPLTDKLPFGNTSITVTVIEPLNTLLDLASSFSLTELDELPAKLAAGTL